MCGALLRSFVIFLLFITLCTEARCAHQTNPHTALFVHAAHTRATAMGIMGRWCDGIPRTSLAYGVFLVFTIILSMILSRYEVTRGYHPSPFTSATHRPVTKCDASRTVPYPLLPPAQCDANARDPRAPDPWSHDGSRVNNEGTLNAPTIHFSLSMCISVLTMNRLYVFGAMHQRRVSLPVQRYPLRRGAELCGSRELIRDLAAHLSDRDAVSHLAPPWQ